MAKPQPVNPVVKAAVAGAGLLGAIVANQVLEKGWSAVFDESAPTDKAAKQSAKDVKAERKQAKKDGAAKTEVAEIQDPMDDMPVWKLLLWTAVSGIVIQGLRLLAERGAQRGTERLLMRRPRPNRG